MILAGDIGGTHTRLAVFEGSPAVPRAAVIEVYPSRAHGTLPDILREFLAKHPSRVEAACFGIAGPVRNGRCETPNLPWIVDSGQLAEVLGPSPIQLLNDLEANAHGIAVLRSEDLALLNQGAPDVRGSRALISAGTGLGEAGLLLDGDEYRPYPSEGGHADFAPRNEIEIELLRYLLKGFDHVSYERILSGPGLYNAYRFLRDTNRGQEPSWLAEEIRQGDPAAVISGHALEGRSDLCMQALDLFVSVYGAEAGNLALRAMAMGGVFIGGGIAPRILSKLQEPAFLRAFTAKGRVSKILETIPIRVILNDQTALLGAGRLALQATGKAQFARPSRGKKRVRK